MLDLNDARREYAEFLRTDPKARWRMDAALAHVVEWAYRRGLEDGRQTRSRIDIIGSNGNDGLHYEDEAKMKVRHG